MDDYIRRKKRIPNRQAFQNGTQFIIREAKQQIDSIMDTLSKYDERVEILKQKLINLKGRTIEGQSPISQGLLGETSIQKSQLKAGISDGNPSNTDKIFQKNQQLGGTAPMASGINAQQTLRQTTNDANGKLPPAGKTTRGRRQSRA